MACEDLAREALEPFDVWAFQPDLLNDPEAGLEPTLRNIVFEHYDTHVGGQQGRDFAIQYINAFPAARDSTAYDAIGSGVKAEAWVQNAKALIELNEKGAVSHPVPGLAVDLLRSAVDLLSTHTAADARPSDDRLWDQTLTERDNYHDAADKLAEAIGELLGVNVGEHSSAHSPWETALEHAGQAVRNRASSTHTAAGAGPVGEAVASLDETSLRARIGEIGNQVHNVACEHQNVEDLAGPLSAIRDDLWELAQQASVEEPGEAVASDFVRVPIVPTTAMVEAGDKATAHAAPIYRAMVAARPVEEPGEAERLTRDLAWLRQCNRLEAQSRLVAEAALAETRERLEKVEAELRAKGMELYAAKAYLTEARELLDYITQTDRNNDGYRIVDMCFTAFMAAKKPNKEDGGPSDWMEDTRPLVLEGLADLRRRAALTGDAQEAKAPAGDA